jgi:glycerol kinase
MNRYIGAIDQGTTSTRFIIFDRDGRQRAVAQREHRQIYPAPGWVEHDALEIWRNTENVIAEALSAAGLGPRDLAAVGVTNQRETTLLWDRRTGTPLANAIVWQDTRVETLVAEFARDGGTDRFRAQTGLPLASYFSGLKLRWLLDHIPDARAKAEAGDALFGTIDTWLLWRLTGEHLTDVTNASRTQLMSLAHRLVERGLWPCSRRAGRRAGGRRAGRPAGGAGRPDLLQAGRGEEHLRHRLLPADEHRDQAGALDLRPRHHRGLPVRRGGAVLCA